MKSYEDICEGYRTEGRFRSLPPDRSGTGVIDLASNDYMGLGADSESFLEEFHDLYGHPSMTSSASRLLSRHQEEYGRLEERLGRMYVRKALLFNSGYHANVGIVSALNIPGTLFLADKLVHASMIDGLTMRRADFDRWRHNDTGHLRRLIEKNLKDYDRIVVMAEAVYSMDGDMAPLRELSDIRLEYPKVMLYIDEAHSFGVFGPKGRGLCMAEGIEEETDIIMGTFGKACASSGAFAAVSQDMKDYLVNSARSFIFSTAIPPACAAWSDFMISKLEKMDDERRRIAGISSRFRGFVEKITGKDNPSRSQIVPLLTGDARSAVELSRKLESEGILALPIRKPTVPEGTERLRFSLNAALTDDQIETIENALK